MLHLIVNRQELLYDLYALTQAFYPGAELETVEMPESGNAPSFSDTVKVCLYEQGGKIHITPGDILSKAEEREYPEEDLAREAEVFLQAGMEMAAARKRALKNLFYDLMVSYTGRELPWGNLTGIRPTKLIRKLLQKNSKTKAMKSNGANLAESNEKSREKIAADKTAVQLYDMHRLRGEKLALGIEIARLQEKILSHLHGTEGYSVYIGIPFCPSRCLYCSFTSNPVEKWKKRMLEYLAALKKELEYVSDAAYFQKRTLDTVYIGGGTPTALSPEELDILLENVTTILPMENVREFTVEAGRADSITKAKLDVLQKYHVTRISINPQTMKEETLRLIGRRHTVGDVREAFAMARKLGFDNINMDIILGLPGETDGDVEATIREIRTLMPDSLTVHSLAVKRAAGLKDWYKETGDPRSDEADSMQRMMEQAMKISSEGAKEMGMVPYYLYRQKNMAGNLENTGYSLSDKYGLYNILIMEEVQSIVALGAGSVSKRVDENGLIERCDNVKDIGLYLEKIDEMVERKKRLFEG